MKQPLFFESGYSYSGRTRENVVNSDITIAFALDFTSAGEIATRNACAKLRKPYFQLPFNNMVLDFHPDLRLAVAKNAHIINFAGNGIYTFAKKRIGQEEVDRDIYTFIKSLLYLYNGRVFVVRSGGQTGVDEAAIKAAMVLDLDSIVLAPKGWMFRDVNGKDISDEKLFKARFK